MKIYRLPGDKGTRLPCVQHWRESRPSAGLDRLGDESVVFRSCYSDTIACGPGRCWIERVRWQNRGMSVWRTDIPGGHL